MIDIPNWLVKAHVNTINNELRDNQGKIVMVVKKQVEESLPYYDTDNMMMNNLSSYEMILGFQTKEIQENYNGEKELIIPVNTWLSYQTGKQYEKEIITVNNEELIMDEFDLAAIVNGNHSKLQDMPYITYVKGQENFHHYLNNHKHEIPAYKALKKKNITMFENS